MLGGSRLRDRVACLSVYHVVSLSEVSVTDLHLREYGPLLLSDRGPAYHLRLCRRHHLVAAVNSY